MGYHITLSRRDSPPGITAQEWRDFVAGRSELEVVEEDAHFITAILDGDDRLALHYSFGDASVFANSPDGPRIIEYMASIAPSFAGVVTGDEGETYATQADWGTQADWEAEASRNPEAKPWWKRELSRGKRVAVGLLLGALALLIKEILF